jgi:acetolactate synthase-1/2/3 large subunit
MTGLKEEPQMNGAESLVKTLLASGIRTCFANPGTSEMHFVAALDRIEGMRCILGLTESVVTGAADGYGRMSDMPAATLLHCGPGLANGLSNLHNARRAMTGIVNIVGDQATYHRPLDPALAADTEGWAHGVSASTRTARSAATVGAEAAVTIQAARTSPGQIATLIAPADTCWDEGGIVANPLPVPVAPEVAPHKVVEIGRILRRNEPCFIVLGGAGLRGKALDDAYRIASATGAKLMAQVFNGRVERGRGRPPIQRLPYNLDQSIAAMAGSRHIILIGSVLPVAPFAYPGKPGRIYPDDADVHVFARPEEDIAQVLAALADELDAPALALPDLESPTDIATGKITQEGFTRTLAALLPDNAIVADESVSFGRTFFNSLGTSVPHDWLQITGGAIGSGIPMATGAAVAQPSRRVVSLQADGAGMFTVQGLWTQARENLAVTTVIFSNKKYQILIGELANVGANPGRVAMDMLDIGRPDINWVGMAQAMGVEAARAETMEEFTQLFAAANKRSGPFLIELII